VRFLHILPRGTPHQLDVVLILIVLLAGLLAGGLLNLVATRLAAGHSLFGPLHCTRSSHPLSVVQALPVVGYAMQRGRCSTCGKRISVSYPLVEIGMAGLFVALLLVEGFGMRFLLHAAYAMVLVLVLVIDWKHRDIYVTVIAVGALLALAGSVLGDVTLWSALAGAALAGGFFLLAYLLAKLIFPRIEEPLGAGDILLALMMGLMLGFPDIVGALLIGPLIAGAAALILLLSRRSKLGDFMPYGVALCVATLLFLVVPEPFANALNLPALQAVVDGVLGR
jgi:prepilin signal peptidase PulO-like enzyme (type II secretory pathway)